MKLILLPENRNLLISQNEPEAGKVCFDLMPEIVFQCMYMSNFSCVSYLQNVFCLYKTVL